MPPWENIGTVYHYHDADGDLMLEVVRTTHRRAALPAARPGRPPGHGGWKWRGASSTSPATTACCTGCPACAPPATPRCGSPKARRTPTGCTMKG